MQASGQHLITNELLEPAFGLSRQRVTASTIPVTAIVVNPATPPPSPPPPPPPPPRLLPPPHSERPPPPLPQPPPLPTIHRTTSTTTISSCPTPLPATLPNLLPAPPRPPATRLRPPPPTTPITTHYLHHRWHTSTLQHLHFPPAIGLPAGSSPASSGTGGSSRAPQRFLLELERGPLLRRHLHEASLNPHALVSEVLAAVIPDGGGR